MPKQIKTFDTQLDISDQSGETLTDYYSNSTGQIIEVARRGETPPPGYSFGIQASNATDCANAIKTAIATANTKEFEALLSADFKYQQQSSTIKKVQHTASETYRSSSQRWLVRPMLEALFHDKKADFIEVVDRLIAKNDNALSNILITQMANSELRSPQLYVWNASTKNLLLEQIDALKKYGEQLCKHTANPDKAEKGRALTGLAAALTDIINQQASSEMQPADPQAKLEILRFKARVAEQLHSADTTLNQHRRVLGAIGKMVLAAGINPIVKLFGQNELLSDKTKSEQLITETERVIGFGGKR